MQGSGLRGGKRNGFLVLTHAGVSPWCHQCFARKELNIKFTTDSQSRQCRPHGKEGRWASAGKKPIIHLIGILGREQPGLKNSCFQVQLENVNETHFFSNINLSTSTEVKTGFKSAKVKKISRLIHHSVTKIHYTEI